MGIEAVIFDFNGVLIDDEAVHFALFRDILAEEGVTISEQDYQERYLGYDDRGCFQAALADAALASSPERLDELIARKARRYLEVADEGLIFFPAAAETLKSLAAHWPLAICSGALRSEIEHALRRLDRLDCVAVVISAEDTDRCKPDPEGFRMALAGLQDYVESGRATHRANAPGGNERAPLTSAQCLVVEDSLAGIISAKRAGMRTVGVTHTYPATQLAEAGADAIVTTLETLTPSWIRETFMG
jgi:beta-phosphoglucomutase-like phosphatase (HAD superfamily)